MDIVPADYPRWHIYRRWLHYRVVSRHMGDASSRVPTVMLNERLLHILSIPWTLPLMTGWDLLLNPFIVQCRHFTKRHGWVLSSSSSCSERFILVGSLSLASFLRSKPVQGFLLQDDDLSCVKKVPTTSCSGLIIFSWFVLAVSRWLKKGKLVSQRLVVLL